MHWGGEWKGKASDLSGDQINYVVRYQGGTSAGQQLLSEIKVTRALPTS